MKPLKLDKRAFMQTGMHFTISSMDKRVAVEAFCRDEIVYLNLDPDEVRELLAWLKEWEEIE